MAQCPTALTQFEAAPARFPAPGVSQYHSQLPSSTLPGPFQQQQPLSHPVPPPRYHPSPELAAHVPAVVPTAHRHPPDSELYNKTPRFPGAVALNRPQGPRHPPPRPPPYQPLRRLGPRPGPPPGPPPHGPVRLAFSAPPAVPPPPRLRHNEAPPSDLTAAGLGRWQF